MPGLCLDTPREQAGAAADAGQTNAKLWNLRCHHPYKLVQFEFLGEVTPGSCHDHLDHERLNLNPAGAAFRSPIMHISRHLV
jgi:hypothetical protein